MSARSKHGGIKAAQRKKEENKFDKPESLTLLDVQCSVCIGIFIEPVTLPCCHTVCKVCFEKTIDNNTLACPLCRKYVGGWVRQRQKHGLMVNNTLWAYISENFKGHVQKKLRGEDDEVIDGLVEFTIQAPRLSEPGLIRREYEAEQKRLQEEAKKREEQEALASEKLIKELQAREEEEKRHLEELRKKAEEEDALIAMRIAAQLEAEEAQKRAEEEEHFQRLVDKEQSSSAFVRVGSIKKSTPSQSLKKGPMDMFLSQKKLGELKRTSSSSSTDSLSSELHHFRPVHYVARTPPKKSSDADADRLRKPVPIMRSLDGWSSSVSSPRIHEDETGSELHKSADGAPIPSTSTLTCAEKRGGSPSGVNEKSPKKLKSEPSPKKNQKLKIPLQEKKVNTEDMQNEKGVDPDSGPDCETEFRSMNGFGSSLNGKVKVHHTQKPVNGLCNVDKGLIPLSLQNLSDPIMIEQRFLQEKEDYKFAMKLQEELNALEGQNRTYELRSVVKVSPKKKQSVVATPKAKAKSKSAPSSSQKEKRRQCTLEESMNFSVKMEL